MKWKSLVLLLSSAISAFAIAAPFQIPARGLEGRNPEDDARAAILGGELNFLGIAGFSITVPGIDEVNCKVARESVDIMPGTGDVVNEANRGVPLAVINGYALRYNLYMKAHRKKDVVMNCWK